MSNLPEDSATRKRIPVYSGFLAYFSRAVAAVAAHSLKANEKHNPGEPLHWSHEKSNDHVDCIARHLLDLEGVDEFGDRHDIAVAWRAMAALETRLRNEAEEEAKRIAGEAALFAPLTGSMKAYAAEVELVDESCECCRRPRATFNP